MSFILNIDTAVQSASLCLAENEHSIGLKINPFQKDHAAWLHPAIKELFSEQGMSLQQLNAIAISAGPGSYTGLRVGMATAKGLCYALNIPLILVNTLKMMAVAGKDVNPGLLCPMIDARRMEVFTAIFNNELQEVMQTTNMVLDENSFKKELEQNEISFFGNGSIKFQAIMKTSNAHFRTIETTAAHMSLLAFQKFKVQEFADLAYSEPYYGKDFHSSVKQSL